MKNRKLSVSFRDGNASRLSVPLPDQEHLNRFNQIKLKKFQPELYQIACPVIDLAYAYLYVLEKLWQLPSVDYIRDELTYTSNNAEFPLSVTFRKQRGAPFLMTTEHAAWAVVGLLRKFRQDKIVEPRSFFFTAYNWEISIGRFVIGTVSAMLEYREITANSTIDRPLNVTISSTNVPALNIDPVRSAVAASSVGTSKRDRPHSLVNDTSTPLNKSLVEKVRRIFPNSLPQPIQVSLAYTANIGLVPRDIADIAQFIATVLMERPATEVVASQYDRVSFEDSDAITRPLLITIYYGWGATERPLWWNVKFADLVYGVRQTLFYLMKNNRFDLFKSNFLRLGQPVGVVEVETLGSGFKKKEEDSKVIEVS